MLEQYRTEFILKTRHSRYGFTLLEGIMALSVLLSLLVLGNYYTQQRLEEEIHQLAAEHLILVSKAATGYVREHYEQIGTEAEKVRWQRVQQVELNRDREYTPLSLEAWRYQQMQDYLKKELLAEKNCYQQSYEPYISDHLPFGKQLIVLSSEGQAIELKALPVIARKADGSSGYIIQKKAIPTIIGSQHSWKLAVPARTVYNSGENPQDLSVDKIGPGHLARVQIINRVDTLNPENLLHRTPVPGKPELNQMETNLTMQQHQIIFNNESATGILDAEGLQFTQPGEKLLFGWEKQEQQPKIVLRDAKQQEVLITAQNVMATTKNHLPQGTTDYSPPELHAFWNKLPYYEMTNKIKNKDPSTEDFARKICLISPDEKKSNQPLGRMFLLGRKNTKNKNKIYLYVCGDSVEDEGHKITQAYKIFPEKKIKVLSVNRKKTAHSRSRGITSLETLGFLTALIMIASLCASIVQNYYKKTRAVSAARHLKKVNDAACAYLKDNFSQLKSHAITNKTIKKQTSQEKILIIKLQQLIDQGYLPNGFSKKSVYSQEYRIQIRVPIEKRKGWQVWTTTEKGDRIDRHAWTVIGSLLKYHGFYRSELTKKIINGLRQLSDNRIIEIDPGHIAFLQVIDNAKLYTTDSFIYRKLNDNDSPRPMQTSLRLDKNSTTLKKSSKEVKLNNQSLELKNRTYIANLELLNKNKENIPTIHLKESHSSDSKSLTITPSTLKISRNSLFDNRIEYDISNKKAKIIFTESESQLHWNPYWNHIPYHQNNDSQDTLTTANKICHYGIKVASREALGRLFIIESKKNIQIFICGKNQTKHGIEAYNLFSVQKPLKKTPVI